MIRINNGGVAASDIEISLSTLDPFVVIDNTTTSFDNLNPEEGGEMIFEMEVNELTPIGHIIIVYAEITAADGYATIDTIGFQIGSVYEDFETGDFTKYPWEFEGSASWIIENTEVYEGDFGSKSGSINDQQQSAMYLELDVLANGEISFYKKVSCENDPSGTGYDRLTFTIDDQVMGSWDGNVDWSPETYSVTKGLRTFKWVYSKDANTVGGSDCAWVDYIELPPVDRGLPLIFINPESVTNIVAPDQIDIDSLSITNIGGGVLDFTIDIIETDSKNINDDVSWLDVSPVSGSVNANEQVFIEMTFNTMDMVDDEYTCNIIVTDNNDLESIIPVTLIVDHTVGLSENDLANTKQPVVVYPNPFSKETLIYFRLDKKQNVKLDIYNSKGEKIITLLENSVKEKGNYRILWNGRNENNKDVPEGIYFYSLTNEKSYSGKILLQR